MNTLYFLTDDLRLEDNPTLVAALGSKTLTFVFCIDEKNFFTDRFGNRKIGVHRWRFVRESLLDLMSALSHHGQTVNIIPGNPGEVLSGLLASRRFDRLIRSRQHAVSKVAVWQHLCSKFPDVRFDEYDCSTLYSLDSIQFAKSFLETFSQFRRNLDGEPFRELVSEPKSIPKASSYEIDGRLIEWPDKKSTALGGARNGKEHLNAYFETEAASTYKETRNELSGNFFSTGFSPWLAQGCLSPMQIFSKLQNFERANGANESTRWILFELMWREFFRWHAKHHRQGLFEFSGINGRRPLTSFYRERFLSWRNGNTPWPIVNACMNELRETGALSNRGRQIVASALVNELGLDWRCGAGYFEEALLDYDQCSNWGNWQYIAGVGSDPKGGRHFNLDKQAELWDADNSYRRRWAGDGSGKPLDRLDYYGWPSEGKAGDSPET